MCKRRDEISRGGSSKERSHQIGALMFSFYSIILSILVSLRSDYALTTINERKDEPLYIAAILHFFLFENPVLFSLPI